jgi:16S rRNA (adenine1518-N6/adenine1519-N6)-dimethyltransferase
MSSLVQLLREREIRPSKKLGQNFLVHTESADKIVRWAAPRPGETVLEIGPGLGALSEALLRAGTRVIAIEKDKRLAEILRERWTDVPGIELICGDALATDFGTLFRRNPPPTRIVANLPYSISTPILERLLEFAGRIDEMVFLLQEEVVDRLAADVGTKAYGRLSIWVQTLCEIERGPRIPKGSFYPAPDVESRLIRLRPLPSPRVPEEDLSSFLKTVALLFQHRRKSIRNSLKDSGFEVARIDRVLADLGIEPVRRAETFPILELYRLSRNLNEPHG